MRVWCWLCIGFLANTHNISKQQHHQSIDTPTIQHANCQTLPNTQPSTTPHDQWHHRHWHRHLHRNQHRHRHGHRHASIRCAYGELMCEGPAHRIQNYPSPLTSRSQVRASWLFAPCLLLQSCPHAHDLVELVCKSPETLCRQLRL